MPIEKSTGSGEDDQPSLAEERPTSSITGGCDIGGDPPPRPLTKNMMTDVCIFSNQKYPDYCVRVIMTPF